MKAIRACILHKVSYGLSNDGHSSYTELITPLNKYVSLSNVNQPIKASYISNIMNFDAEIHGLASRETDYSLMMHN
jgi:hypothetical protein